MTELIVALKHCAHSSSCVGCPLEGLHEKSGLPGACADATIHRAADVIESLTTWRDPVNDPPARFQPVLVSRVKDPEKPPIVEQGFLDLGGWWKVYGTRVKKIIGWMPMPEGPGRGHHDDQ